MHCDEFIPSLQPQSLLANVTGSLLRRLDFMPAVHFRTNTAALAPQPPLRCVALWLCIGARLNSNAFSLTTFFMHPIIRPIDAQRYVDPLPKTDQRILAGFHWYIPRYLRKHFHAGCNQRRRYPGMPNLVWRSFGRVCQPCLLVGPAGCHVQQSNVLLRLSLLRTDRCRRTAEVSYLCQDGIFQSSKTLSKALAIFSTAASASWIIPTSQSGSHLKAICRRSRYAMRIDARPFAPRPQPRPPKQ